jgi:amidase
MKRRSFLAATAVSGVAGITGCGRIGNSRSTPAKTIGSFEFDEMGISEIAAGLAQGRWTSRHLVEAYFSRIESIDRNGPRLGAIIELNPDAAMLADQLDGERKRNSARGPLHGIPVLIKDNIDTADKMSTSAGSLALSDWHAPKDSFVAARLRAAGALILGKTNLSEWANFRSTHSVSGWSGRGGQAKNPYALHRNPSGSSSGSGAAVAASLCGAAIGTETDGSVVSPASINGIVGMKPTVGLISRAGIIPISHNQDTAGPMARSVRDAAMLLSVIAGTDPDDAATSASTGKSQPDYTKFLDASGLRGARVGIARKFFEKNAPMDRFLNGCIDVLKKSGAEVIDPADLPSHNKWNDPEMEVLLYEFKADLNAYLAKLPASAQARSLAGLIEFNEKNRNREMPWFEQEIFHQAEAKGPVTDKQYLEARQQCLMLTRSEGIDAVMDKNKLDALVTLTSGPAWLIDLVNGDTDTGGCSSPPAIAGYPHITVPAGFVKGLPVGLSFFGRAWSEPVLFRLAYSFETATKARRAPQFLEGCEIPEAQRTS